MMICPNCQSFAQNGSVFCERCGTRLVQAPAQPMQAPVQPMQRPVQPMQAPVQPMQAPVQPVQAPVQPVQAPVQPVQAPVQPVQAPVQPVQASAQPMRDDTALEVAQNAGVGENMDSDATNHEVSASDGSKHQYEYKVMSQKDRLKFDLEFMEQKLNSYAKQGWRAIGCGNAACGMGQEFIILLEREL